MKVYYNNYNIDQFNININILLRLYYKDLKYGLIYIKCLFHSDIVIGDQVTGGGAPHYHTARDFSFSF